MSNFRKVNLNNEDFTQGQGFTGDAAHVHILDANGNPYFTAANPAYVQATDLDIRDLSSTQDSVEVIGVKPDGTNTQPSMDAVGRAGYQIITDGTEVLFVNADGSINSVVTATDLDIRDLTSVSDSVEVVGVKPDGTNTMPSMDAVARAGYQLIAGHTAEVTADPIPVKDHVLGATQGDVTGINTITKFGAAINGLQPTATDIWDRADATPTQQIWVAPTQARIHDITSTSTADDGTPEGAGAGAQAVRVYGLTSWSTSEVTEDVILNGTTNVATSNSYVIIYRMKVIPVGSTYNVNTGNITATAQTDATVTAQITAGKGQTLMTIFGWPSTESLYLTQVYVNLHDTANPATAAQCDFELLVNEHPDIDETTFIVKHSGGCVTNGTSDFDHSWSPYKIFPGPGIIKIQGIGSAADLYTSGGFDGYIRTN